MTRHLNITEEKRSEASRRINAFLMFTEDVLADPSVLDRMPDHLRVHPIPKAEREPGRCYDIETERTVVMVTPIQREELAMHNGQNEAS